jgi:NAD(P)-dependent dehydrogenase (short-subunit alcohol dehydrogenase family)
MKPSLTILTGASRGMGLALARQLLARGGTVLTLSRTVNESLVAEASAHGATLVPWSADLAGGAAAATRLAAWLAEQPPGAFGSATLINNAGVIAGIGPLSHADAGDLAHALRVGLEAPMQLTAAFLHATAAWQVPRKVLNISSGLGRRAMASQAGYCAAKAGMDHFTRDLGVGHLRQQVVDAVQAGLLLVHRLHHPPGRLGDVGALQHHLLGLGVVLPAAAALQVHRAELPLLERVVDAAQEAQVLLVVGDREPVLDELDARAHQHALELGHRAEELLDSSSEQKPITRSTPARLYQLRSNSTISPAAGRCAT